MGFQKYATKSDMLEANRHYLIEEYTGSRGEARSGASLAKEMGVSRRTMTRKIAEWRFRGLLGPKPVSRLDVDRDSITDLYLSGWPLREIASKFECSHAALSEALRRWGVHRVEYTHPDELPKINLDGFRNHWADITEETIITIGRIPKFRLIPIGKED